tara:strand:- start:1019 stop:1390 length:372 start_codon:yes stop_codon:yes gene_type:complete
MDITTLLTNLPMELQRKIYDQSFQGSANEIFKEFLKDNQLFRYNWNLHYERHDDNYTLFAFLRDCRLLKHHKRFLEGVIFDVEEFVDMILDHHMGADLTDDDFSTDDQSSDGEASGTESEGDW